MIDMIDNRIKFGLIGCGFISTTHAEILTRLNETKLECVSDSNEVKLNEFSKKYNIQKSFTDFNDIFNEDIDAVIIGTPNWLHSDMIVTAAKAGKHVLVEKPISIDLKGADKAIKACKKNEVKLSVFYQYRFCPPAFKIKQLLDKGCLGKLIVGFAHTIWPRGKEYYNESPWRSKKLMAGGGTLLHQAIHMIDLLQWYFGTVNQVYSLTNKLLHDYIEVEDVATGLLKFKNGALGTILTTTACPVNFPPLLSIYTSKGSVSIENFKDGGIVKAFGVEANIVNASYPNFNSNSEIPIFARNHAAQVMNFVSAIKQKGKLIVDGEEARKSLEIVLRLYESSKN